MSSWFNSLVAWISSNGVAGGAIVAALVAFTVFILTRIYEFALRWGDKRAARRRAVVGLFTEVRYNLTGIEKFLDSSPYPGVIQAKVRESQDFRPMIIVDETTQFYASIIPSLPDIEPICIERLTEFYSVIRKLHDIRDAIEGAAFPTISPDGRAGTIDDLWSACRQAEKAGWKALYELELAYPRRWFSYFRS